VPVMPNNDSCHYNVAVLYTWAAFENCEKKISQSIYSDHLKS